MISYREQHGGHDDVVSICQQSAVPAIEDALTDEEPQFGFAYLIKSGRHYKIGRSNAAGRREREIALQLPEKATTIHVIRTDDPPGIEAYWHQRFAESDSMASGST